MVSSKVTSVSRNNKESGYGGEEGVFGICGVWDQKDEADLGSDATLWSPGLPHLLKQRQMLTILSYFAAAGLNHLCLMALLKALILSIS